MGNVRTHLKEKLLSTKNLSRQRRGKDCKSSTRTKLYAVSRKIKQIHRRLIKKEQQARNTSDFVQP